jgi:putative endonuclease
MSTNEKLIPGFSARYDVSRFVRYEVHERIDEAIAREKSLKTWRRDWKIALIEGMDPDGSDPSVTLNR